MTSSFRTQANKWCVVTLRRSDALMMCHIFIGCHLVVQKESKCDARGRVLSRKTHNKLTKLERDICDLRFLDLKRFSLLRGVGTITHFADIHTLLRLFVYSAIKATNKMRVRRIPYVNEQVLAVF